MNTLMYKARYVKIDIWKLNFRIPCIQVIGVRFVNMEKDPSICICLSITLFLVLQNPVRNKIFHEIISKHENNNQGGHILAKILACFPCVIFT